MTLLLLPYEVSAFSLQKSLRRETQYKKSNKTKQTVYLLERHEVLLQHSISAPRLESIYEKLFTAPTNFKYGSIYKVKPTKDVWTIFWEPERLYELTTFTMMSTICAALNSQRRLLWVIGVGRNRKVLGCEVSNEERDTLSQAFIYCVRSGILPQLHPELVQLRFISVDDQLDDKDNTRLLVEIVIEHKVSTLYQLSPGRIFYVSRNEVEEVEGGIDEARRMLKIKYSDDWKSLLDQASYGYLRYKSNQNGWAQHSVCYAVLSFLASISATFVPGLALGFSVRFLVQRSSRYLLL
ncbi:hypothetical protein Y032_0105g3722 [Ancylostoma ceylanicum]|uniref:Uncharacterized protein n=1 Tax=Ancylostoma ceylanicum TaxID=53326 RepID=A0A016TGN1_9BILA|nr:hypothetical protein Y032_0105g3722 [Ancylostoma ceylanicum]